MLLDSFSIGELYFGMLMILLISFETGYQITKYSSLTNEKQGFNFTSPMVGGLLGMLAFVLAITFGMAAGQHNDRKQNVLNEANAIGTAYLRADLLSEPHQTTVKKLLKEYVDIRIDIIGKTDKNIINKTLDRSEEINNLVWSEVSTAVKQDPLPYSGTIIESINEMIDINQIRITGAIYNRIPHTFWLIFLAISVLTMVTMGFQARISKARRLIAVIPLIIAFTTLTEVILDLDRPQEGMITVGQEAMINMQKSLKEEE
jgi:hypothetical protein